MLKQLKVTSWAGALALAALALLAGCGYTVNKPNAAEITSPIPASSPSFSLSVSPASVTLSAGAGSQTVAVTAISQNGFTGAVSVTLSGTPPGVTVTPASLALTPGTPQNLSLAASQNAADANSDINFNATAGSLRGSAQLILTVMPSPATPTPTPTPAPAPTPTPTPTPTPAPPPAASPLDVTTYHNDNSRTGQDLSETVLTPSTVNAANFGKINLFPVDGSVDGEPLYVAKISVGGQTHNVLYVVTEHDSVYAFDADAGTQLWRTSLLGSGETTSTNGCYQISPEVGITATPVIDRSRGPNGTIFVVGMSQDSEGSYHQRLHALDLTTGAELAGSPTEVQASFPGTGDNSSNGKVIFDPGQYAERAGLLLLNGTIYTAWTSHCDARPYTGWLMAYNESNLQQSAVLNLTPNGNEGSIWMSGAGLAADSEGNIYFLDANGTFDSTLNAMGFPAQGDYGNAFLKVSTLGGSLTVVDYFALYNTQADSAADLDLGSGGVLLLPDANDNSGQTYQLAVGAGKDGNIYVVDRHGMGKFNANNNGSIHQELAGALPAGAFSMPAYFNNTVYYGGVGAAMQAFPVKNAALAPMPSAVSVNTFNYPGATPSISANGTSAGIVWAVQNSSPAVLYAYDASNLQELYDSTQAAGDRDNFGAGNKFITPMIANGKVYVGTPAGVAVFGLLR